MKPYAPETKPLVSIGMPIYNEERHLDEALDSLLAQDYENFELIISDNCSQDATQQICTKYASKDNRIHYVRNEINIGGVKNFSQTLKLSQGEFFMWAAGHDLWRPSFISRCLECLFEDESVVLAYPQMVWIDVHGQELGIVRGGVDTRGIEHRPSRFNTVLWGIVNSFPINGLLRSSALKNVQISDGVFAWDILALAELSLLGSFAHVSEPLFLGRKAQDFGNFKVYVEKLSARSVESMSRWEAQKLYWRMFSEMFRASRRQCYGYGDLLSTTLAMSLCMFTKHRWMLKGLRALKR